MIESASERADAQKPAKPPLPDSWGPWPLIPVDETEDSPFRRVLRLSGIAADAWTFGPEGPYRKPQTAADTSRGQVREALLYLLELGLIDIDEERLNAAEAFPLGRQKAGDDRD